MSEFFVVQTPLGLARHDTTRHAI